MASADMCEHEWPGTGCEECKAEARERAQQAEPDEADNSFHSHEFAKAHAEPAPAQDEQDMVAVSRATLELCTYALREEGYPVLRQKLKGFLNAAPIAQTAPRPTGLSKGWNLVRQCDGFVIGHSSEEPAQHHKEQALADGRIYVPFLVAQAAPQPEQSGLVLPRELVERCVDRWACCSMAQTPGAEKAWSDLRAALSTPQGDT